MNRNIMTMQTTMPTLQEIVANLGTKYDNLNTNWAIVS